MAIDMGNLFPQTADDDRRLHAQRAQPQTADNIVSFGNAFGRPVQRNFNQWNYGFNLSWELDFWGRFRRAIEAERRQPGCLRRQLRRRAGHALGRRGDAITCQYRTTEQRIEYAEGERRPAATDADRSSRHGSRPASTGELDVDQARSARWSRPRPASPSWRSALRQAANQLCILLGIPPEDLQARLGTAAIPTRPPEVAVGIPADLLRRRPDVRRAERQAAAQSAQIGIAEADFYPAISIIGTIGYSAEASPTSSARPALDGTVGPSFNWNILNYGRILNNVRLQTGQVPGAGGHLPTNRAQRRSRGGERAR